MLSYRQAMLGGVAVCAVMAAAAPAAAQVQTFDIPAQPARTAIPEFGRQSGIQILAARDDVGDQQVSAVKGEYEPREALRLLLAQTDLRVASDDGRTVTLVQAPQGGSASDGADGTVEALIVTAQKREEDIQDVPIAISAFTQEDLTRSQIAGGPDLITQVPNMTFTKTNFTSYTIQIRGIGTQAISATTDPAVAVAFNNTPFITNRFFEQEFYDLQRVEVLRGPQGTLYGRNATAGVVNIISAKPKFVQEAKLSGDVSNFNSMRLEGMINIPLVEDKVALRLAGAWTKRDGYATNEISGNPIDGRDLWSTRLSLRFTPTDRLDANLIWEHFEEDDDRLRSGKQLCKKHNVSELVVPAINGRPAFTYQIPNYPGALPDPGPSTVSTMQTTFSQGCLRGSLYSPEAFQTPNGQSIPYYYPLGAIGLPIALQDPYVSLVQSQDLRVIESTIDPDYRAKADIVELQVNFDLTDTLTLASETAYNRDFTYSLQDFNRFNTAPGAWRTEGVGPQQLIDRGILDENGFFCDPQLGCSDRLVAVDIATGKTTQFSQEFRLASDFEGPFNFSLGANFLRADNTIKYYVFINSLSLNAAIKFFGGGPPQQYIPNVTDNLICLHGAEPGDPNGVYPVASCVYMDPNPIGSLNDNGHNYFLSKNPYKLISYAVFGEAYYNITDNLKVTAGLRWTVDKKEAPRVPSWTLASASFGYPVAEVIEQEWREPTGRLTLDWKPDLAFTDDTMIYGSYAHGYKAGGANPPGFVRVFYAPADEIVANDQTLESATRPRTFDPEFVDAYEIGTKNTLADGKVTLNLAAFYYDYKAYQISEIVDRSAFNRNFDTTVWGVELEADWRPLENLKLGLKGGYQDTRIADGEKAIDLMDRTAGVPGWSVVRPFPTFASSCILPTWLYFPTTMTGPFNLGPVNGGGVGGCEVAYIQGLDPVTHAEYQPNPPPDVFNYEQGFWLPGTYPGWDPLSAPNGGEGFDKELGGNQLPNAPHWTWTITGDYTVPLPNDWLATIHTDLHWQGESYWRVFQDSDFSVLDEYFTMNLAAIFTNEERGWNVMAYIKNVTDETAISGAFLNSDDTGLTANVFLTEPRLYGLRVTKAWSGGGWWTGANPNHPVGEPYPLTVEIGGQVQRHDAPYEALTPPSAAEFSEALNIFDDAQNRDLDWGDGRELKITWRPGGPWTVSGGVRYGRTNNGTTRLRAEEYSSPVYCMIPEASPYAYLVCFPDSPYYQDGKYQWAGTNFADATARSQEDHTIVDFAVGRDFGLGVDEGASRISLGLRSARFGSQTQTTADGIPDWLLPDGWFFYSNANSHRYQTTLSTKREFEGVGPTLSWEASQRLFGDEDVGHVNLDWSLTGGMLFGKQETSLEGSQTASYWSGKYANARIQLRDHIPEDDDIETTALTFAPRSNSVTVPMFDVSLGLSYEIQRIKIGAGYRWERYFDVLDGGFEEHKDYDRTIDGPYFKLAVGFGG